MLQNSEYVPWVNTLFDSIKGVTILMVINSLPVVSSSANFLLGGFIERAHRRHLKYSADRVDRRLASQTTRPDIWTQVLRREGDQALSLGEMHANSDLFMIAGTETTATLVSGLFYLLLMNPDKMKKLQDEIRASFKEREDMSMVHLAQLKYLNACIEESFRMYPPVPSGLPRVTPPGGAAICGEWISANASRAKQVSHPTQYLTFSKTTVYVTPYAAYTSPTNFRAPNDYIPERWISSEYDTDHKSVLQPFSVGPRNCVGKKYVPLIALFHQTQFGYAYGSTALLITRYGSLSQQHYAVST
jgi:cytochrome P450